MPDPVTPGSAAPTTVSTPAPAAPTSAPAPAPAPSAAPQQQRPIDTAFTQMLADDLPDLPPDYSQDNWDQPDPAPQQQQPTQQPAPTQYPQPVTPAPVPGQPQQQTAPTAPQQQPTQVPTQQPQDELENRLRQDPFGVQADMLQRQEAQYVQALAEQVYPVSTEDVDAFLSGDGTKISQALARVHVNAVGSMMRVVSQQMPVWVSNMLQAHAKSRELEDSFWNANPHLDRTKHKNIVLTAARAYRQMNPNASVDEMNQMVGAMAAVAAKVVLPGNTAPQPTVQPNPAAPEVRTPGPRVRQAPAAFQPVGNAPVASRGVKNNGNNAWSDLAFILQADQAGKLDNVT